MADNLYKRGQTETITDTRVEHTFIYVLLHFSFLAKFFLPNSYFIVTLKKFNM